MKTFVVEMDEEINCEFCSGMISIKQTCAKEGSNFKKCKGVLVDRPEWCPMREITTECLPIEAKDIEKEANELELK